VRIACDRGVGCRQRIFGAGSRLDWLWFARWQLGLEDRVELLQDQPLSRVAASPRLRTGAGVADLDACDQWRAQLRWADVVIDCALEDPLEAVIAAARSADRPVISVRADAEELAAGLIALASTIAVTSAGASDRPPSP
jgi:hypothetical protein